MILGYGKVGPDKDLPGYDFTAFFGRGGYTQNLRRRGNDPITMIPGLGDNNVGLMLAMGIITALYNREKTGKGDFVTTSLYETATAMTVSSSAHARIITPGSSSSSPRSAGRT